MKKIGLLTALLVAGLLLTGCNKSVNVENEQERIFACGRSVSEYFGISDYSISWDKEEEAGASFVLNGCVNIGNGIDEEKITKNVQCVVDMVDKSVTIQEVSYDIDEYPWELKDLYHAWHLVGFNHELTNVSAELIFTDKIIGAKFCNDMGSDDYSIEGNTIHVKNMVQNEMLCDSEELMEYERKFDLSNAKINIVEHNLRITTSNGDVYDFFKNDEELELSEIEKLKQSFTGTIIDGTNLGTVEITQDDTLYFNDKFGFAVVLGGEWNGGKIEAKTHNEQFGENAINRSIHFYKEGFEYDVYSLTINKIEKYDSMKKQDAFWTEDEFEKGIKGKNNKYLFMGYANDQLAPYIDTTNEYQQLFLNGFVFYDVDVQVKNPIKVCVHYFDGCNRCTMQDDGNYICTEEACEQHQQPYCDEYDVINL